MVNADSMQVYDGLRILTARPTIEEEQAAEHRLYGFVDPRVAFSAGDYVRAAAPLLVASRVEGRLAVIVGGTGLYFKALTEGLVAMPEIPAAILVEIEVMPADALDAALAEADPEADARLGPADRPRRQRALAVKRATGRTLAEWQREATAPLLPTGRWTGAFLAPDRATLYARIDARFEAMMAAGALDEARRIRALGLPANRGVMKAHGMPHLIRHLDGAIPLEEAIRLGRQDTRNYAKRQFTWARRFMGGWRRLEA